MVGGWVDEAGDGEETRGQGRGRGIWGVKRSKNLWERVCSFENLAAAAREALLGKRGSPVGARNAINELTLWASARLRPLRGRRRFGGIPGVSLRSTPGQSLGSLRDRG